MHAWVLQGYAGPEALRWQEVAEPKRSDGSVLVDVVANGINFPDLLITKGLYQHKPELPFVPGCEVSGVVSEVGEGSEFTPGDRVAAFVWEGGYGERVAVPEHHLVRLSDDIDFADGAALQVNYHTTYFGLVRRGRLRRGERVLVLGAGGGIGTAAIQVAKGVGATVFAGVANEDQLETAKRAGADAALVLSDGFSRDVRRLAGAEGVDLVVDPVGDWLFLEGVRSLAPEGRILVIGFAAGEIPTIKVNRLLLGNLSVVGVAWGAMLGIDQSILRTAAKALGHMVSAGSVRPEIGVSARIEDIPALLGQLERGEIHGKAIATRG